MTGQYPIMISLRDAVEFSGLSYDRLRKMCLTNQLVHMRSGSKFLINRCKLLEYLEKGEQEDV